MHNFIKVAAISILSLCALASCGKGVRMESIDKSYSTDTIFVDAKIPQITGLGNPELAEKINEEYKDILGELLEDFEEVACETGDKSTFVVETTEHYNKKGFFSVVTQIDSCTRNQKKASRRITKNIDTRLCSELAFSDLFSDDGYIDMINAELAEIVAADSERYSGLWDVPKLRENQDFYIDGDNIILYYPPYELSYYERGFVEVPLSVENMSGYLKPEYRRLIEN